MTHVRRASSVVGGLAVVLSLVLGGSAGAAQDATPASSATSHPAHIHEGTCDNLNPAPLYPLNDVTAPVPAGEAQGNDSGSPIGVETSTTSIDASLDDLTGGDRAINIHESVETIETYIACGDIGGSPTTVGDADGGRQLAIGLGELNGSGYSGVAVLREAGDQTEVSVYLVQATTTGGAATPEAASGSTDAAAAVQVDMKDFAFGPASVTIPVGGSVTWTNRDTAPHTATAQDRDVLQSGTLQQGESFTATFDTPGTYEYFCEFHPNMKGTVVVE